MEVDIKKLARLSRLRLTAEEETRLQGQFQRILAYVQSLQDVDTEDIEPMYHAVPLENVLRKDEVAPSLPREDALRGAPEHDDAFFIVPRVIT